MRAIFASAIFVVGVGSLATAGITPSTATWNMDHLEKTYGMKFKSVSVSQVQGFIRVLMVFTKDAADVKKLCADLMPLDPKKPPFLFYLFDKDKAVIGKLGHTIDGEITGKQGDALRILISLNDFQAWGRVRKVEARPKESDK